MLVSKLARAEKKKFQQDYKYIELFSSWLEHSANSPQISKNFNVLKIFICSFIIFCLGFFRQKKETTTSVFATSACVNTSLRVFRLLGVTHVFLTDNMVHCMFGVWCYLGPVLCMGGVQFLRSLQDFLKSPYFKTECLVTDVLLCCCQAGI